MRWLIAVLALLAMRATGQELPNPVTGGEYFDISGMVADSVSASPLPGASVSLTPNNGQEGTRSATTNGGGEFRFPHVRLGVYELGSKKRGYAEGVDTYRKVILVGGTQPSRFELKLDPEAMLSGVVLTDKGQPIEASAVLVLRQSILNGHKRIELRETAKTDDKGAFRFLGLGPGPCYVAALPLATKEQRERGMAYPPTFYPNSTDPSTAQVLELKPGQDQEVELRLKLEHGFSFRGKVIGARDTVKFSLLPAEDGSSVLEPAVDVQFDLKTMSYTISGVPPGNYLLQASAGENEVTMANGFRSVLLSDHDLADVDVTLMRGPSLRGTVRVEGGGSPDVPVRSVSLQSLLIGATERVNGGSFSIRSGLPPRKYRLTVDADPRWFVRSATQGGNDVLRGDVLVAEDGPSLPVAISMAPGGGVIEATVTWPDTGLRKPARVTVLEQNHGEMRLVAETRVAPPNSPAVTRPALIGSLPAGQYVVYAFPEPLSVEYSSQAALQPYDAYAQNVTVGENEQTRAALKVVQVP